jgi:hypothetical protein
MAEIEQDHPSLPITYWQMATRNTKVVVLLGAGSTLADASGRGIRNLPPLDRGFFGSTAEYRPSDTGRFISIVAAQLGIDLLDPRFDSLEMALSMIRPLSKVSSINFQCRSQWASYISCCWKVSELQRIL